MTNLLLGTDLTPQQLDYVKVAQASGNALMYKKSNLLVCFCLTGQSSWHALTVLKLLLILCHFETLAIVYGWTF